MLDECLRIIQRRESAWTAFQILVDWLAWGLAVSGEMPRLDATTNESLYRIFNLEPLLTSPHDYLGSMLADRRSGGWNPHAFFPTPHTVSECMAQILLAETPCIDDRDPRLATVIDPAVGSGRLLLHASNYSYCLYGCDIDPLMTIYITWNMNRKIIG